MAWWPFQRTVALKQVIVVNSSLKMGKGKTCAQVAHASLEAYLRAEGRVREAWRQQGAKKVVVKAPEEELLALWERAKREGLPVALIKDAGLTQLKPGSITALAIGPAEEGKVDKLTGHLKLL